MKGKSSAHSYCTQAGTQEETRAHKKRRKRPLPDVTSSLLLNQRFVGILWDDDPDVIVYIYRATADGYVIRPMLAKWMLYDDLEEQIRKAFGPGRYAIYMRNRKKMLLAATLSIGPAPKNWRSY